MDAPKNNPYNLSDFLKTQKAQAERREKEREIEHNIKMAEMERKLAEQQRLTSELQTEIVKVQGMEQRIEGTHQKYVLYTQQLQAYYAQSLSQHSQWIGGLAQNMTIQMLRYQRQTEQNLSQIGSHIIGLEQSILTVEHTGNKARLKLEQKMSDSFNHIGQMFNEIDGRFNQIDARFIKQDEQLKRLAIEFTEHKSQVVSLLQELHETVAQYQINTSKALHQFEQQQGQYFNQIDGRLNQSEKIWGQFQNKMVQWGNNWESNIGQRYNQIEAQLNQFSNDQASLQLKNEALKVAGELKDQANQISQQAQSLQFQSDLMAQKDQTRNYKNKYKKSEMKNAEDRLNWKGRENSMNEENGRLRTAKANAEWLASDKFKNAKHTEDMNDMQEKLDNMSRAKKKMREDHRSEMDRLDNSWRKSAVIDNWKRECEKRGIDFNQSKQSIQFLQYMIKNGFGTNF